MNRAVLSECRNTKPSVMSLANEKGHRQPKGMNQSNLEVSINVADEKWGKTRAVSLNWF